VHCPEIPTAAGQGKKTDIRVDSPRSPVQVRDPVQPAQKILVGDLFSPMPQLKTLYFACLAMIVVVTVIPVALPLALFENALIALGIVLLGAAFSAVVAWWIPLYYGTMVYRLTATEITWRRGVWFRQTGIVPYNRITNIDIMQGPLMRMLSISTLRIQTAGYSSQSMAKAGISLQGIQDAEALREMILEFVRGNRPVATESDAGIQAGGAMAALLSEVKAIRAILDVIARK